MNQFLYSHQNLVLSLNLFSVPDEGGPRGLWTGGFFRILKGLSVFRIVQPSAGVHQQRGRGRDRRVAPDMLM